MNEKFIYSVEAEINTSAMPHSTQPLHRVCHQKKSPNLRLLELLVPFSCFIFISPNIAVTNRNWCGCECGTHTGTHVSENKRKDERKPREQETCRGIHMLEGCSFFSLIKLKSNHRFWGLKNITEPTASSFFSLPKVLHSGKYFSTIFIPYAQISKSQTVL